MIELKDLLLRYQNTSEGERGRVLKELLDVLMQLQVKLGEDTRDISTRDQKSITAALMLVFSSDKVSKTQLMTLLRQVVTDGKPTWINASLISRHSAQIVRLSLDSDGDVYDYFVARMSMMEVFSSHLALLKSKLSAEGHARCIKTLSDLTWRGLGALIELIFANEGSETMKKAYVVKLLKLVISEEHRGEVIQQFLDLICSDNLRLRSVSVECLMEFATVEEVTSALKEYFAILYLEKLPSLPISVEYFQRTLESFLMVYHIPSFAGIRDKMLSALLFVLSIFETTKGELKDGMNEILRTCYAKLTPREQRDIWLEYLLHSKRTVIELHGKEKLVIEEATDERDFKELVSNVKLLSKSSCLAWLIAKSLKCTRISKDGSLEDLKQRTRIIGFIAEAFDAVKNTEDLIQDPELITSIAETLDKAYGDEIVLMACGILRACLLNVSQVNSKTLEDVKSRIELLRQNEGNGEIRDALDALYRTAVVPLMLQAKSGEERGKEFSLSIAAEDLRSDEAADRAYGAFVLRNIVLSGETLSESDVTSIRDLLLGVLEQESDHIVRLNAEQGLNALTSKYQ